MAPLLQEQRFLPVFSTETVLGAFRRVIPRVYKHPMRVLGTQPEPLTQKPDSARERDQSASEKVFLDLLIKTLLLGG